jgi:Rad3-related DNA helicase
MIVDEAHSVERSLVNHEGYTCSLGGARILGVTLPLHPADEPAAIRHPALQDWMATCLVPAQVKRLAAQQQEIAQAEFKLAKATTKDQRRDAIESVKRIRRERHSLQADREKCEMLVERAPGTFVAWSIVDQFSKQPQVNGISIKPLEVRSSYRRLIAPYGEHVLLMSATLYPRFLCSTLGIPAPGPDGTGFLTCPSPFPLANHRIKFFPVGDMGSRVRKDTMPALLAAIQKILERHRDEKGIIHAQTNATVAAIQRHFAASEHGERLLVVNKDGVLDTAGKLVRHHIEGKVKTVLLSPSMQEGVDLPGDSSNFQILVQVPWPDAGDPWIAQRKLSADGKAWYAAQAAQTMVQALGRSLRTVDDHCVSYILDERFRRFYEEWPQLFPDHITKSLEGL